MAILAILFAITAQTVSKSYKDRYFSQELNSLRKIHLAILAYAEDQRNAGETPMFPGKLQDLLPEHYLSEKDLDPSVIYICPQDSAPLDSLILQRSSPSGMLICTIQGPPQKAEQTITGAPSFHQPRTDHSHL